MKELSIVLFGLYCIYVGYFVGINRTSFKRESLFFKGVMIAFGFCGLWINIIFETIEVVRKYTALNKKLNESN